MGWGYRDGRFHSFSIHASTSASITPNGPPTGGQTLTTVKPTLPSRARHSFSLRCIELNGDWDRFFAWVQGRNRECLQQRQRLRILTDQPMELAKVA